MTNTEVSLSVKEAAEETDLSEHTLRYYERIGLLNPVKRNTGGHRRFSTDDLGWINFLKCLRNTGMSIEDMKEYAECQRGGDEQFERRITLLKHHRDKVVRKIDELQQYLETVDYKIGYYGNLKENT